MARKQLHKDRDAWVETSVPPNRNKVARALIIICGGNVQAAVDAIYAASAEMEGESGRSPGRPESPDNDRLLLLAAHIQERDKVSKRQALLRAAGDNEKLKRRLEDRLKARGCKTLADFRAQYPEWLGVKIENLEELEKLVR